MRQEMVEWIFRIEGGYVNDPLDRGGETNMGITHKALQEAYGQGLVGHNSVSQLTTDEVAHIYEVNYYNASKSNMMPMQLDWVHFDAAVNHGPGRAGKFLQQVVNHFGGSLVVDGALGPASMSAINEMIVNEKIVDIIDMELEYRISFYHRLVEKYPEQVRFLKGWLNRVKWLREAIS